MNKKQEEVKKIEKLKAMAERGKADFYFFCKYILGTMPGFELIDEVPHKEMCTMAQCWDKNKKLILTPRDTFKTTIFVVAYSLWLIINNPEVAILLTSDKQNNSYRSLAAIKDVIERHAIFRACYGNLQSELSWTEKHITVSTRKGNKRAPTIMTAGADSPRVGMHFDYILFDDPHNEKNISTPEQIIKIINYYKGLHPLLDTISGRLQITATRWHHQDIHNYILTEEKDGWDVFIRAAEWEEDGVKKYFYPSRLTPEFLEKRKKEMSSYFYTCTPKETPILMSDFTTKPISEIVPGDCVIGYELGDARTKRKLVKTKVLEINSRTAMVCNYKMKSGRKIRCTRDHNWFTGRTGILEKSRRVLRNHKSYSPAKIGSKIPFVYLPDVDSKDKNIYEWGYLAGILDGEGACKYGSITIHQSLEKNKEVCEKIKETLGILNLKYHEYIKGREGKGSIGTWVLSGGIDSKIRLLEFCNLAKKDQILRNIWKNPGSFVKEFDEVLDISDEGYERVYALTTETGNYIAWGYASKNCQYQNSPTDDENAVFHKDYIRHFSFVDDCVYIMGENLEQQKLKKEDLTFFLSVDPAGRGSLTEQRRLDYSGFIVVGLDYKKRWFIFEAMRKKNMQPSDIVDQIIEYYFKYKPEVIGIEAITYQGQIKKALEAEFSRRNIFQSVRDLHHHNRDKGQRIRGLQPFYKDGKIYHAKGLYDLEMELLTWSPSSTLHDDLIDPLAYVKDIAYAPDESEVESVEKINIMNQPNYHILADMAWTRAGCRGTFADFLGSFKISDALTFESDIRREESKPILAAR